MQRTAGTWRRGTRNSAGYPIPPGQSDRARDTPVDRAWDRGVDRVSPKMDRVSTFLGVPNHAIASASGIGEWIPYPTPVVPGKQADVATPQCWDTPRDRAWDGVWDGVSHTPSHPTRSRARTREQENKKINTHLTTFGGWGCRGRGNAPDAGLDADASRPRCAEAAHPHRTHSFTAVHGPRPTTRTAAQSPQLARGLRTGPERRRGRSSAAPRTDPRVEAFSPPEARTEALAPLSRLNRGAPAEQIAVAAPRHAVTVLFAAPAVTSADRRPA